MRENLLLPTVRFSLSLFYNPVILPSLADIQLAFPPGAKSRSAKRQSHCPVCLP